ncbi:MAG: inositol monophosphatase family protein [Bacillaceae bacterium]
MDNKDVYKIAIDWVKEAGEIIKSRLKEKIEIHTKSSVIDLVTNVDREIELFFISKIEKTFPTHHIVGEEGQASLKNKQATSVWYVDPIDGTMNFVNQQRNFCISVAFYENGKGVFGIVYDVIANELYHCFKGAGAYLNDTRLSMLAKDSVDHALIGLNGRWLIESNQLDYKKMWALSKKCRGLRAYGCAALEFVYVAMGSLQAYISPHLSPWDYAAGIMIVEEVGGEAVTFDGQPLSLSQSGSVLVSNGLTEELLPYVREV